MKALRIVIPLVSFAVVIAAYTVTKIITLLLIGLGVMVLIILAMNPGNLLDRVVDRGSRWCAFCGCTLIMVAFLPILGTGTSLLTAAIGSLVLCFAVRVNKGKDDVQESTTEVRRSRTLYYSSRTNKTLTDLRCDPKNPGPEVLNWQRYGMSETQTLLMQIGEEFTERELRRMRTPYVLGYNSAVRVAGDMEQLKRQIASLRRDVASLQLINERLKSQIDEQERDSSELYAQFHTAQESEAYWRRRALERENDLLCLQDPPESRSFDQLSDVEVYQLCEKMTGKEVARIYGTNEAAVSRRRAKGRKMLEGGS